MTAPAQVRLRRVYEAPDPSDGQRVLVDRLWPRGLAKNKAAVDEWLKTVAPSDELRRWYGHEPDRFPAFRQRYQQELRGPEQSGALDHLRQLASHGTVTLLTATRDIEHSQAAVLAELLRVRMSSDQARGAGAGGADEDRPGDPACWLRRVCPECGSMADHDPPTVCPQCHAEMPAD